MFEHLGPTPEVSINKPPTNYKLYLSLLSFAVVVFIFASAVGQGAHSKALEPATLSAKVLVDSSDKKIVTTAKNFPIFSFTIDIDKPNTSLYKLNILVDGIYDLDLIGDLKLFHENVQLGGIQNIDAQGKIYFDLAEYELNKGLNNFSLFFNNGQNIKEGSILSFSIEAQEDIFLTRNGHIFKPDNIFPISSGIVSIINKGSVSASNVYVLNDFLINSDVPQQIASFELSSIGERVSLDKIKLAYDSFENEDVEDLDFILIYNDKAIAKARSTEGKIVFNLAKSIILDDLNREKFYLHTIAMPEGAYKFHLEEVRANGLLSGLDINLLKSIDLSKVWAKPYFIQFESGDLDKKLSEGWNKLYSLDIKAKGIDTIYLNKLTWQIDKQNLDIEALEIWKNGEPYIANVVSKGNKVIMKMDGLKPLEIFKDNTEILLLANLKDVGKKASIQTFILGDDIDSSNITWSDVENFYNSYKIPYLPLEPSILSN
ncbi:MAG: hypothetical protein HOE19_04855 [Candidatus Komeilibacteria bacterium]|nr:hypothetical protein [Candidatus Komeilibacteria bacterium]MBT4447224.1 hypothetical protein [Candidatus Komeilibacteria bacterium]